MRHGCRIIYCKTIISCPFVFNDQGFFNGFLLIRIVAFFSRLLDRRIWCCLSPSVTIINAVLGGMLPRLSANMLSSFTSFVPSSVISKWSDRVLSLCEKAINWLTEISPEHNRITGGFEILGVENNSAFDSQALLELKKEYCDEKRCLDCAVGNALLKSN